MKLVSVAQMRALEAAAFAAGSSEDALQANAARVIADEAAARLATDRGRIAVLVGHGNNGRDGALAAMHLAERAIGVDLVLAPRHAVRQDELDRLRALGASITASENTPVVEAHCGSHWPGSCAP
jgi:NAD(P)H-hydrate repair Nnr-like enzyme with NAD(P)H-hydrate epimerase domain